jgi:hypothetical protein
MSFRSRFSSMMAFAATIVFAHSSYAGEYVSGRFVTHIGCHHSDGTCFVVLSGPAFGASENCAQGPSTQFRFDNAETPHGRRTYASFMSAYLLKKRVDVSIVGCSSQGIATLSYFVIYD